jgi:transcription antitermination factor NusG
MLSTLAPRGRMSVDRTAPYLWYTLSVIPQSQARVCQRAKELGITTYVPMSRTPPMVRKFGGRNRVVGPEVRPLMPGYVFVSLFALDPRFYLFQGSTEGKEAIHGALRLLSGPDGPMAVSEAVIEDMRLRERNGEFDLTGLSEDGRYHIPKWAKRSTVVKFTDGPFKGFLGRVVKSLSDRLIEVSVNIFGRISNVSTPLDWIRREA